MHVWVAMYAPARACDRSDWRVQGTMLRLMLALAGKRLVLCLCMV